MEGNNENRLFLTETITTSIPNPTIKNIDWNEIPEEDKYDIEYCFYNIKEHSRPLEYFTNHPFFKFVTPVIKKSVRENITNLLIEIAIYAYHSGYDKEIFFRYIQEYWKEEGCKVLTEERFNLLAEVLVIIEYVHKPRRKSKIDNNEFISINSTTFKFKAPKDSIKAIYPNEFYYFERISKIKREISGDYKKAAKLIIPEFIDIYNKEFADEHPMKTMYDAIFGCNKTFNSFTYTFSISNEKIYQESSNPLTFAFLIALSKAYETSIQDSNVRKVINKEYFTKFRNLWWSCKLYNEHNINSWEYTNYQKGRDINTMSEAVRLFKELKFLELTKEIELTPQKNYYQAKGRPITTDYDDFINNEIINNDKRLELLVSGITEIYIRYRKKNHKGEVMSKLLYAAKQVGFFSQKPSFEKFKKVFISNRTCEQKIEIGKSTFASCKQDVDKSSPEYDAIYSEMRKLNKTILKN